MQELLQNKLGLHVGHAMSPNQELYISGVRRYDMLYAVLIHGSRHLNYSKQLKVGVQDFELGACRHRTLRNRATDATRQAYTTLRNIPAPSIRSRNRVSR